jgi:hypothetical protein
MAGLIDAGILFLMASSIGFHMEGLDFIFCAKLISKLKIYMMCVSDGYVFLHDDAHRYKTCEYN